jgi:gamma-glutamylaminecyclotransferase
VRHRIFVYGTLLRGEPNHGLLASARFLGPHRTEPRFTLLLLGAYPGLVETGKTAVHGEVYAVDGATLRLLDRLEEYPRLYDRRPIRTPYGTAWAYVYRGPRRHRACIGQGDWRAVSRQGPRARGVQSYRDPKNPTNRQRLGARAAEKTG